jgi:formate hydrogenlyase transcriptional activator
VTSIVRVLDAIEALVIASRLPEVTVSIIDRSDVHDRRPRPAEPDLRHVVDAIPAQVWRAAPDGAIEFVNQQWIDYTGLSLEQSRGWNWSTSNVIHGDDLQGLLDTWRRVLETGQQDEAEARVRRFDGAYRWFLIRAVPFRNDLGAIEGWYGTNTDIEDRKRAEALLAGENRLLQMLAQGDSLVSILDGLCRLVEGLFSGSFVSIMLLNPTDNRLWYVSSGGLPRAYTEALDGVAVGPSEGSCGTAAYRNEPVIVPDIATDPLWSQYRDIAHAHGLRACWSTPIRSSAGQVLGTFAILSGQVGSPTTDHRRVIEQVTHLASVAIARTRDQERVRGSEAELRQIVDAIPQLIVAMSPDGKILYANESVLESTGFRREDVMADDFRARLFHPDDLERVRDQRRHGLEHGVPFESEMRARLKDGLYRWFLVQYKPVLDEHGRIRRWYATGTDIDDRKRAEDRIRNENIALREEISHASMFEEIVGSSDALHGVLRQIGQVAPTDSTVLITGETGTGKELIARAIHKRSARSPRAFISVNCAAVPAALIASELFGHERGAFTGALERRQGRFELAEGGTIFLDEVGELSSDTQVMLLRVLQEREFQRVGGNRAIRADVRVIAATNLDLQAAAAARTFRADLFYRLNVFPIDVPSLRERRADIPLLVEYFVHRYAKRAGKRVSAISKKTLELLQAYPWPGNVRELQNVIERAVIISDTDTLSVDQRWLKRPDVSPGPQSPLDDELVAHERARVEAALAESNGRVSGPSGAAARLGIPRSTLESKIRSLKVNKHRFKTNES